jgi:hypothetical protein
VALLFSLRTTSTRRPKCRCFAIAPIKPANVTGRLPRHGVSPPIRIRVLSAVRCLTFSDLLAARVQDIHVKFFSLASTPGVTEPGPGRVVVHLQAYAAPPDMFTMSSGPMSVANLLTLGLSRGYVLQGSMGPTTLRGA